MDGDVDIVNKQYIYEYLPAIIIVVFVILVGFTGNAFVAFYYGFKARKSVVQFSMFVLALNDAITNIVLVEVVVWFFYAVTYRDVVSCKVMTFLRHWLIGNSLLFIVAIAMDRFRRVCLPFSKQFTIRNIRYVLAGLCVFSFALSARYFVTMDVIRIKVSTNVNVTGYYCSRSENADHKRIEGVFHYIDMSLHAGIILSLVIMYALVIRKVLQSKKAMEHHKSQCLTGPKCAVEKSNTAKSDVAELQFGGAKREEKEHSVEISSDITNHTASTSNDTQITKTEFALVDSANSIDVKPHGQKSTPASLSKTVSKITKHTGSRKRRKSVKAREETNTEIRITVMVAVVTLASILCFIPYFLAILLVKKNFSGDGFILDVWNTLLRRSYILNSFVNPIILVIFDMEMRKFLKLILCQNNAMRRLNRLFQNLKIYPSCCSKLKERKRCYVV